MAHNYRGRSDHPDYQRGERYYSGADRDRARSSGGEQYREPRDYYRSSYDARRFDEGNRWSEGRSGAEPDDLYNREQRSSTSNWHENRGDRGGYFGTGSYIDDGGASRGFGDDFERARAQVQRRYGQPFEGQQSERSWRNQPYDSGYPERSGWEYAQRAGSGQSGGAYGYDSGYRSDFSSYAGERSHRGRGPQGYQRSDERLKEIICERLTDDHRIDATNVSVDVSSQAVKLTGTVEDRHTKYEIEELIERLGGVKDIDNQLRVQGRSNWTQSNTQSNTQSPNTQPRSSEWDAGTAGRGTSPTATPGTSASKRN